MAVNKVEINGEVKLDLTADTVTAAKLAQGETAHDASGQRITGTMHVVQLQLIVTVSAGATVTATNGSKTISGMSDSTGVCTLLVPETTLTEPLVVCPFFVAVTVYFPVSVTVKTAVPLLVFVAIVVPPFFSVTDAPESTLTVIVAEKNVSATA